MDQCSPVDCGQRSDHQHGEHGSRARLAPRGEPTYRKTGAPLIAARLSIRRQVSSGGVAFRRANTEVQVALVCVGEKRRWQLPKGIVDPGESPETTAARETLEEAGLETSIVAPLSTIEYWFVGDAREEGETIRVRFHKHVHFFLLEATGGDVARHDSEVVEARWFSLDDAEREIAFASERKVLLEARALLDGEFSRKA